MPKKKTITAKAIAEPTKRFFVSMLTRDISLSDAILDLVDNCLDGALRMAGSKPVEYSKHTIAIELSKTRFSISDDCGGIPRDIAMKYAFKMGREADDDRDLTTETIGMYGVGMKRAIFKMGKDSVVKTKHGKDSYKVPISSQWLDAKGWEPLPIEALSSTQVMKRAGTTIEVTNLYPAVSRHFDQPVFRDDLRAALGEHFTLFLQRGLTITLNGEKVVPIKVQVLVSTKIDGPAPYMYQKQIGGVKLSIVIGMNTGKAPSDDEINDFESNRSAVTAGWSVFCNDRAVIVGDKGRLTGWGDGVPMYHGQFSVITGMVEFRAKLADQLPITTTKRALDTTSDLWLEARTKMREGMRIFISHTNVWKNQPRSDQSPHWKSAKPLQLEEAIEALMSREPTKKQDGAIEFDPKQKKVLPIPEGKTPTSRRITFSKPIEEIQELANAIFEDGETSPSVVGEKCFEIVLEKFRDEV
jgi:hypothetical protein